MIEHIYEDRPSASPEAGGVEPWHSDECWCFGRTLTPAQKETLRREAAERQRSAAVGREGERRSQEYEQQLRDEAAARIRQAGVRCGEWAYLPQSPRHPTRFLCRPECSGCGAVSFPGHPPSSECEARASCEEARDE